MMNSLSLLVAILVSLQCTFEASAQDDRNGLNNNLQPNVVPSTPRRRSRNVVHIREAPPSSLQLEPGTRLVLKCEVLGRPSPTVQWMKNGEPVVDYEEETNDILPAHPSSAANLISQLIVNSAVSGDVFTCVATSGGKQDSASTTVYTAEGNDEENLLTLQKLFRLPAKPMITTYFSDVFQNIGTDIILPCRVDSFTKAQIFWQDRNENVIYGNSRMRVLPSGDLLLTSLRWSDMGNFTCIAKNMYGKDVITTFVYPVKVA
ncbi:neural/ectodermal development factor IMP-L2-like [Anticarsia gemmatalis]|uniref:neural/ectodermal development factor IMP-L2-like n=1 Tax=Anticarsia gemmatalis TaxID=129554 RepID=UPI003F769F9B